ncbi:MAG: rhodanese-like domain-containing protein [bacterium]|nr:rhodanese-like domain-containing protein [bacterium]
MKKFLMISFLVMFFITGCLKNDKQEIIVHDVDISVKSISYLEVKEIIDTNNNPDVVIIDVRSSNEYNSGHLKTAVNLPLESIENINLSKNSQLIVYCQSGRRSHEAAVKLISLGYENVYDMGGIGDWPYEREQ